jgi:ATP-binding cassette subfamily B protein
MAHGRSGKSERSRRGSKPPSAPNTQADETKVSLDARHWRTLAHLAPYLWPKGRGDLKARVAMAAAAMILAKLVTVALPFFYKGTIDALTPAGQVLAVPFVLILGYGLVRLLMSAIQQLRDSLFVSVGQYAQRAISVETFKHLHALSLRFHLERRTGGLSRLVERGANAVDFLLRWLVFNIVPTLFELAMVCAILAHQFSGWYAVVTALTVVSYVGFTFRITEWRTKFYRDMIAKDAEAGTRAIDSLINFETVKYFGNEAWEARRYDASAEAYARAYVKSTNTLSLLNAGQALIFTAGMTALMLMAGFDVVAGRATVGDFVLINTFLLQLSQPLNMLGFVYREIKQGLIDMERMFALREIAPEIADRAGARELEVKGAHIEFSHVDFRYEPDREILKDVSFEIRPGETVAVVGPSGAGKSTLARILFRFYDVAAGRILIDGQDVRDVTQASLRRAIGTVPQDTVLFNDTIRYNIAYGRPGASEAQIIAAAQVAQIHEFVVSLPHGYETLVGERGLKLSGGEKQRVAIARTVLKAPPILILDEATSALDSHTEEAIQSALEAAARGRTSLVIAHRLSTIVNADLILVMEAGRIVERGTHAQLVARGGLYASLWNRQREIAEARERLEALADENAAVEIRKSEQPATASDF